MVQSPWDKVKDLDSLRDALLGVGTLEAALQVLSAHLPIGLIWEAKGGNEQEKKEAAGKVKETNEGQELPKFEKLVQEYACLRITESDGAESMKRQILDEEQSSDEKLARMRLWLSKLGEPEQVLRQIDELCDCQDAGKWTENLAKLRDCWLSEMDEDCS